MGSTSLSTIAPSTSTTSATSFASVTVASASFSSTSSPTQTTTLGSDSGVTKGTEIGIGVGVGIVVLVLGLLGSFFILKKCYKRKRLDPSDSGNLDDSDRISSPVRERDVEILGGRIKTAFESHNLKQE